MRSTSSSAARLRAAPSIQLGPTRRLDDLLGDLADDPICLFWH
jgi:hypothetical protein